MKYVSSLRAMLYAVAAMGMTVFAACEQDGMQSDLGVQAFFAALRGCFVLACVAIGVALYLRMARHTALRADARFNAAWGAVLMAVTVLCFIRYGGVEDLTQQAGVSAANYLVIVLSVLPLPALAWAGISAASRTAPSKAWRVAAWVAVAVAAAIYLGTAVSGYQFALLTYTEGTSL